MVIGRKYSIWWVFFTWVFLAGYVVLNKLLSWLNNSCWQKGSQNLKLSFKLSVWCNVSQFGKSYPFLPFFLEKNVVGVLLICRCRGEVNQTTLAGKVAGAAISSCQFSSFSISTISAFCDSEELHLLRAGQHWVFGEQVGNAGVRWDNLQAAEGQRAWSAGLLNSHQIWRQVRSDKSCPMLFRDWASGSPRVLGRKK